MLYRLSDRYQKEIALSLLSVFLNMGIGSIKAQVLSGVDNGRGPKIILENGSRRNTDLNNQFINIPVDKEPALEDIKKDKRKRPERSADNLKNFSGKINPKFDKADIGGPSQPEMTGFKSIGSDNMVSPFTGDFSYNIPLLDVGGYPVNMFYNSGIAMDQEASWVGLGWNVNPGTITRNMRGLPDDFDGSDKITKTQSFRDDKTFGLTTGANIKLAGFPFIEFGCKLGLNME